MVDKEDRVEQRRITTGPILDSKFTVTSGLKPGEKVIIQGIQKVKPGITVNIEGE